ncbi:MAG: bifunctional serine/threonine-protein kinase/formylglycine-generating enzyme family protein [Desulfovermiculus sp.]|nr:bifunctional serine/threonine-protein kinase/formylglycine-generating enzyme family protein [Desulfovermiculus sp.]
MPQNQLLEEGQVVNKKWEIADLIGKGGKGEVYLAQQINLNRKVALKVMSKDFLDSLEGREEDYESELQRFRREVQVMARIRHPNVLQVYDFDQVQVNGNYLDYIVMEYVPGPTLRQTMLHEGFKQDERAVVGWLTKYLLSVLHGMEAVHALGLVHRDMKPENVLIDEETPKIADFGLAGGNLLDDITRSYHIIGTPPYMPEEQFLDLATTDARTDVYSLGKILYEAIEGKMTQERNKPFETVHLSSTSTRMLLRLDKVIRNATAKDRNHRTSSVKILRKELEDIIQESAYAQTVSTKRKHKKQLLLTAGIGMVLLLLLGAAFGLHLITMESDQTQDQTHDVKNAQGAVFESDTFDFGFETTTPTQLPDAAMDAPRPEKILGSDGMTLRLVPGGKAQVVIDQPDQPDREHLELTESVPPFYMDETKITNHLYVEFLHNVSGLVIKDKTVQKNGQIWLLLGEVREGYEPIVYKSEKFTIKPGAASNPVVRVTPAGAMAYARFYGRTLSTMAQWQRALQTGRSEPLSKGSAEENADSGMMMHQTRQNESSEESLHIRNVSAFDSNQFGIFGLGQNVNEWTVYKPADQQIEFHIHGGLGELGREESYLQRQPWEAFARVGFRTVINVPAKEQ